MTAPKVVISRLDKRLYPCARKMPVSNNLLISTRRAALGCLFVQSKEMRVYKDRDDHGEDEGSGVRGAGADCAR